MKKKTPDQTPHSDTADDLHKRAEEMVRGKTVQSPENLVVPVDITERKQAELEPQVMASFPSENPKPVLRITRDDTLLSLIAANIRDMVVFVDLEGRMQWVNEAVVTEFGYTRDELIGAHVYMLRAPGKNAGGFWSPGRTWGLLEKWSGVVVDRRKDGSEFVARVESFLVRDEHGSVTGIASIGRDISEKVRDEEALHREQEFTSTLLDNITDGVVACDAKGILVLFNRTAREWHGMDALALPPEEWGRHYDLYGPDGIIPLPTETIPLVRAFRGETVRDAEMTIVAKGQPPRHILADGSPFFDVQHNLLGAVVVMRDITERKRAEEALQKEHKRLFEVLETMPTMICLLTPDYHVAFANRSFRVKFGESHGRHCYEYCFGLKEPCEFCESYNVLKTGKPHHWEVRNLDGSIIDSYVFPFTDADGSPLILEMDIDITEQRRAAEKVLEIERRLHRAQKMESLGVLAGGIAHDFNNLLAAILGNLDLARHDLSPVSPSRMSIEDAINATKRAEMLTRQMLAYSGKGQFIITDMDLSELVEENAHLLKMAISKSVTMNLQLDRGLPPISADAGQIQQVVMNIITNASESMGDRVGVVVLSTGVMDCDNVYLSRSKLMEKPAPGRFVWLEVTDTGCGMDEETKGRIFDPFFTTKFTGRGLGMSAVLGIVRGHEGAIMVESEVGKGSTIRVLFPVSKTAPVGGKPKEKAAKGRMSHAGTLPLSGTVLVVDDEEMVRSPCAAMVEYVGYRTLTAANGDEAVALFRDHTDEIVCVILDLTMPGKDGLATFEALRAIKPDVRVILSSGYNEQEATQRFVGHGLAGFIKKPYEMETLLAELERVVMGDGLKA